MANVGQVILGYEEGKKPTDEQVRCARAYLRMNVDSGIGWVPPRGDELTRRADAIVNWTPPTSRLRLRPCVPMDTDGPDIERPNKAAIEALLTYAIAELRHATARHQKAWAKMRKLQEELDGQTIFKDSNAHWQLAVGDVRWWREERASAAANVTALAAALPFATGLPRN